MANSINHNPISRRVNKSMAELMVKLHEENIQNHPSNMYEIWQDNHKNSSEEETTFKKPSEEVHAIGMKTSLLPNSPDLRIAKLGAVCEVVRKSPSYRKAIQRLSTDVATYKG